VQWTPEGAAPALPLVVAPLMSPPLARKPAPPPPPPAHFPSPAPLPVALVTAVLVIAQLLRYPLAWDSGSSFCDGYSFMFQYTWIGARARCLSDFRAPLYLLSQHACAVQLSCLL
jgi:hypothetical protein